MSIILDSLKDDEPFYVDIINFEKHQLKKDGTLARTFENYKVYTNIFDTPQFFKLTLLEIGLYFKLYNLRARYEKPLCLVRNTCVQHLSLIRGTRVLDVWNGLKKLEQNQLVSLAHYSTLTLTLIPTLTLTLEEEDKKKIEIHNKRKEKQPTAKQPSSYFDYTEQKFIGLQDLNFQGRGGIENLQVTYPSVNIGAEIDRAAAWLIEKNDRTKIGGYFFLDKWMKNAKKKNETK